MIARKIIKYIQQFIAQIFLAQKLNAIQNKKRAE